MGKKKKRGYNEHLDHILEKTSPYERMVWLRRAFAFWKRMQLKRTKERLKSKAV